VTIAKLVRRALCAGVAVALPAGCGGSPVSQMVPVTQVPLVQALPAQAKAATRTLIYAAGDESSFVFSLPRGRLRHQLKATGFSACSDRHGNVFFTQVRDVAEYRHGAKEPFATFQFGGTVYSCSVNPVNHDLAVVVFCIHGCGQEIVILPHDGGDRRRFHVASLTSLLYCAYDDRGNLFVDGYNGTRFGLAELRKGTRDFVAITLKDRIDFGAALQWDGEYLAVERREHPIIFRLAISGSSARVAGRTRLEYIGYRAMQSWISGGILAVPSAPYNKRAIEIFLYDYPAGGKPTKIIQNFIHGGSHAQLDGLTFST
jgi:hypothetical protein